MNKWVWIIIVVVVLIGGYYLVKGYYPIQPTTQPATQPSTQTGATQPSGTNTVTIQSYAFSPANRTIKVGDTVTFMNNDSVGHSVTADGGSFDTGIIAQGKSATVTFSKTGMFTYHCSVHPSMKGTIVVQ